MALLDEYLAAVDNSASLEDQLVEAGLAYIRFAHDHPVRFELAFSTLPSKRQSTAEPPAGAYKRLYDLVQRGMDAGVLHSVTPDSAGADSGGADALAYLFWSIYHGMASLQITHLREFDAEFAGVDRAGIRAFARGLAR